VFTHDQRGVVLVISDRDDELPVTAAIGSALAKDFVVERIAVEGSSSVRAVLEQRTCDSSFAAALLCASDSSFAASLIGDLAEGFASRVLVVVADDDARLEALVPKRERFEFMVLGPGEAGLARVLARTSAIARAPQPVDLLASLFRSAIAQRSPDLLLTAPASLDERTLPVTARVADGGRRPNSLWSRWASFGRELPTHGKQR
jgi:hypothetical protein